MRKLLFLPGEAGERALIARLAVGEDAAYRECYQAFAPQVMRVLLRILRNQAIAEEILQEAFIAAFRGIVDFRGETRLVAWLTRIAVNRAFNFLRDEGRRIPTLFGVWEEGQEGTVSQLEDRDLSRRVLAILDEMDPPKRLALSLQAEGYSAAEIAEISGEPRGTILARLARGRVELGQRLAAAGIVDGFSERRMEEVP